MINFFSNIFGYFLNIIYNLFTNYGIAMIVFSVLVKILMLPLSIKQQKTLKKNEKIQKEMNIIQVKHKGNQEKINQEMMELYKREKINPFGGCFSVIIQIILLFAMFYLVKSPLTYMKKLDAKIIEEKIAGIEQELGENSVSKTYPEISIIKYVKDDKDSEMYINMNFLGLDLSKIPQENLNDFRVYIIPILYVISSIISIKISTKMANDNKDVIKNVEDISVKDENKEVDPADMAKQMNKNMSWMMPILSVTISLMAPLGLALYWLVNNIIMIIERIVITKIFSKEEENV